MARMAISTAYMCFRRASEAVSIVHQGQRAVATECHAISQWGLDGNLRGREWGVEELKATKGGGPDLVRRPSSFESLRHGKLGILCPEEGIDPVNHGFGGRLVRQRGRVDAIKREERGAGGCAGLLEGDRPTRGDLGDVREGRNVSGGLQGEEVRVHVQVGHAASRRRGADVPVIAEYGIPEIGILTRRDRRIGGTIECVLRASRRVQLCLQDLWNADRPRYEDGVTL